MRESIRLISTCLVVAALVGALPAGAETLLDVESAEKAGRFFPICSCHALSRCRFCTPYEGSAGTLGCSRDLCRV